ncbi:MAG TPA: tetratricopeptide repeat protein [Anaerolineales bacterium]|nr:tetratricopeptide repeat protein [Anaerolineales bacterium]
MTGRQDLFDESMRLGHAAAWDLQWDKAIEYYRKALAEFPDDPDALSHLGLALLETDQLKEALPIYRRAAIASPDDPIPVEKCAEVFERLGQVKDAIQQRVQAADMHIKRKDAEKAVENWNHIARLNPENISVRSRLALTYERLGRRREAVTEYLSVAATLQGASKVERATEAVQRALGIIPGDPEATLALRLLRQGQPLPAPARPKGSTGPLHMKQVQQFLQAEESELPAEASEEGADPEVAAQRYALSILAGMLFEEPKEGDDESRSIGMAALTSGKSDGDRETSGHRQMFRYLGQAIDMQTRGHKEKAAKEFTRAIEGGLNHPAAHYNLGLLLKESGDLDQARKHLLEAVGHPELALGANLALGRIARLGNDLTEAARFLMHALRLADSLSVEEGQSSQLSQLYDAITVSQSQGDEKTLSQLVENTLNFLSGPEWMQRLKQARLQLESESTGAKVIPIAEMLAAGGTDKVFESIDRIDDLMNKGHMTTAMEEALLAIEYAPNYLAVHLRLAEILIRLGRAEQGMQKLALVAETHQVRGESQHATQVYDRILSLDPVNTEARTNLIDLLVSQDRIPDALKQYIDLADLHRQMAQIDEARRALTQALELADGSATGREQTLKILHEMGDIDLSHLDWRRALSDYERIKKIDPSDEKAHMHIIDLNLRLGQEDRAGGALDDYLGVLVEAGRGQEALGLLEELTREHPGKQALHARLAEAYRLAGRKADAIAQYDALGEIQLDAGRIQDATRTIQTIVDLEPPDVEGYVELLRNLKSGK